LVGAVTQSEIVLNIFTISSFQFQKQIHTHVHTENAI